MAYTIIVESKVPVEVVALSSTGLVTDEQMVDAEVDVSYNFNKTLKQVWFHLRDLYWCRAWQAKMVVDMVLVNIKQTMLQKSEKHVSKDHRDVTRRSTYDMMLSLSELFARCDQNAKVAVY